MENHLKYWSEETNPETGARFLNAKGNLMGGSNGEADIDALIAGNYGEVLTERLLDMFRFENDPRGKDYLSYLEGLGLRCEVHDEEPDIYARWFVYTPLEAFTEAGASRKYPCIFCNTPVNAAAYEIGLQYIVGKEKFMFVCCQNTNWDNVSRMVDVVADAYPVDRERVYITGFSYGGYQATATYMRVPWKFAACAPCGNDIFREWDNWRVPYTDEEIDTLRHVGLPFIQLVGRYEASNFAPLNDWKPRSHTDGPRLGKPGPRDPRLDPRKDPTICPQRKLPDGTIIGTPISAMPHPPEGTDPGVWELELLNKRLYTLGCSPRNIGKCLSYASTPEDEFHYVMGFYADEEKIEYYCGHKHYVANIYNEEGLNTFRYIVWDNGVHTFPVSMGELIWSYFKQFRRDSATGKIVSDEYSPA